jgi:catechol 2,3-dioxygenase-like lactoylglutathione lyase family enzyme
MPTRYIVKDVEESIAFYRDLLGFEVLEQWGPAFAIINRDDNTLWLSGPDTSAAKPMPDGTKPVAGGWNRVVVSVDDLDQLVMGLQELGVRFRNEPLSGPGGSQVLIEDPSGNPVELFQSRD